MAKKKPEGGGGQNPDPALERVKWVTEQMPDMEIPLHPPPILDPKVITFPTHADPTISAPRFLLAANGATLLIIDTLDGRVCAHSIEACQEAVEALLRLANRPE